jgi:hypothetical protein
MPAASPCRCGAFRSKMGHRLTLEYNHLKIYMLHSIHQQAPASTAIGLLKPRRPLRRQMRRQAGVSETKILSNHLGSQRPRYDRMTILRHKCLDMAARR